MTLSHYLHALHDKQRQHGKLVQKTRPTYRKGAPPKGRKGRVAL